MSKRNEGKRKSPKYQHPIHYLVKAGFSRGEAQRLLSQDQGQRPNKEAPSVMSTSDMETPRHSQQFLNQERDRAHADGVEQGLKLAVELQARILRG